MPQQQHEGAVHAAYDAQMDVEDAFLAAAQRKLEQQQLVTVPVHPLPLPPPTSLRAIVYALRHSPRDAQLALVDRLQQHYLSRTALGVAGRVVALPPVALAARTAGRALHLAARGRDRAAKMRDRVLDATIGRVQRSLPYRCVAAYAAMILADAHVAWQLHADAARATPAVHSSSFISSSPASCSLSPLTPGASRWSAIGWRTRRFVYASARFTGQSRRLLFARSLRHWPIDALTLWFQLLLLFLPPEDAQYEQVRESLVDCLRWYETNEPLLPTSTTNPSTTLPPQFPCRTAPYVPPLLPRPSFFPHLRPPLHHRTRITRCIVIITITAATTLAATARTLATPATATARVTPSESELEFAAAPTWRPAFSLIHGSRHPVSHACSSLSAALCCCRWDRQP